ncbi:MAG: 4-(cytidine 5'-diphospho)-2-C-methyl-D-erythritol kinase, partial [Bacteroidales bacterium]|nr:4-(cytidine 5'-diphospho)-2-C-methyl-D-erythritol kinase [Bacteroidales bacterium]
PVSTWKTTLKNDFEPTVFAKYPALADYKEQLYARGALYAAMSGSGSALFGLFPKD